MIRLSGLAAITLAAPATAQMHDMGGMPMPGMTMPAAKPKPAPRQSPKRKSPTPKPAMPQRAAGAAKASPSHHTMPMTDALSSCPSAHAAMGHCTSAATPHAMMPGMPMPPAATDSAPSAAAGTDQPAGNAPPPPPPTTRAADAVYDPAAMAAADAAMRREHGGMRFHQILFNLAELQVKTGRDGYRWDGEGWFGGDIDRLVVRTQGEGSFGDRLDDADVQALYARAIDPYWNLQAGVRQDIGRGAKRTHLAVGVEGLAPYWFDVEATLFLSDKGVRARTEAWVDQRLTQRAILQPRIELNLAGQDEPDARIGAGLSSVELGLRLRYEIAREFAPYVGVTWERRYGTTARFARADGDATGGVALALGLRTWF